MLTKKVCRSKVGARPLDPASCPLHRSCRLHSKELALWLSQTEAGKKPFLLHGPTECLTYALLNEWCESSCKFHRPRWGVDKRLETLFFGGAGSLGGSFPWGFAGGSSASAGPPKSGVWGDSLAHTNTNTNTHTHTHTCKSGGFSS